MSESPSESTAISRRDWIKAAGDAVSSISLGSAMPAAANSPSTIGPFRFCLNMSTIRGQKLTLEQEIDIA